MIIYRWFEHLHILDLLVILPHFFFEQKEKSPHGRYPRWNEAAYPDAEFERACSDYSIQFVWSFDNGIIYWVVVFPLSSGAVPVPVPISYSAGRSRSIPKH